MTPNANVSDFRDQINGLATTKSNLVVKEHPSKLEALARIIRSKKDQKSLLESEIKHLETDLIMLCGYKDEGVSHFSTSEFKISTTGKLTRKITNAQRLYDIAPQLVVNKPALNTKEFNLLARSNPILMQRVLECIETKEARTAVSIKSIEA